VGVAVAVGVGWACGWARPGGNNRPRKRGPRYPSNRVSRRWRGKARTPWYEKPVEGGAVVVIHAAKGAGLEGKPVGPWRKHGVGNVEMLEAEEAVGFRRPDCTRRALGAVPEPLSE